MPEMTLVALRLSTGSQPQRRRPRRRSFSGRACQCENSKCCATPCGCPAAAGAGMEMATRTTVTEAAVQGHLHRLGERGHQGVTAPAPPALPGVRTGERPGPGPRRRDGDRADRGHRHRGRQRRTDAPKLPSPACAVPARGVPPGADHRAQRPALHRPGPPAFAQARRVESGRPPRRLRSRRRRRPRRRSGSAAQAAIREHIATSGLIRQPHRERIRSAR